MYCSDVQGVFDKVDAKFIIYRLTSFNLECCILAVVSSWFRDWSAFVIVNGKRSHPIRLRNVVVECTMWGASVERIYRGLQFRYQSLRL